MSVLIEVLRDEEYREALAEAGYLRERMEEAAADAEHELGENAYYCVAWEEISDYAKRPFRTAVAEALDNVIELASASAPTL